MNDLLSKILLAMQTSEFCSNTIIEEIKEFSSEQFLIRIRTSINVELKLQVRLYKNRVHIDYSYQIFSDHPIIRWDNTEHFPHINTYPHHFHDFDGNISESKLLGNPEEDIYTILEMIDDLIKRGKFVE